MKSSREEQHKTAGIQRLDGDFAKLKSEFGQTHDSVSLYSLMEFFREMSLRDDDWLSRVLNFSRISEIFIFCYGSFQDLSVNAITITGPKEREWLAVKLTTSCEEVSLTNAKRDVFRRVSVRIVKSVLKYSIREHWTSNVVDVLDKGM